jgi:type 1 fimbriae regulatory protein FimB/type 1 fimbriae regulatory protein FimE
MTPAEVAALLKAARTCGRHRLRDERAVLLAHRHGLRARELGGLRSAHIDRQGAAITIHGLKGRDKKSKPSQDPLRAVERLLLSRLRRECLSAEYVFVSERGLPMIRGNLAKVVARLHKAAGRPAAVPNNPHAQGHACGYKLANDGVDTRGLSHYLGHACLQSTRIYTELARNRFEDFWKD